LEGLLDTFGLTAWAERVGAVTISRELLHALALQAGLIAALYAAAWGIRVLTRRWTDRLADRVQHRLRATHIPKHICGLATLCFAWLLLVTAHRTALRFGIEWPLVGIAASLTALWIVLRASTLLFSDLLLARTIATIAWFLIALDLLGLLGPAAAALDSAAITFGTARLSLLVGLKAAVIIGALLWAALTLHRVIGRRMQHLSGISPSVQVLSGNLLKTGLVTVALLIGLNVVGIDLTAFAVLSGAIGVGIGLGLQKIVANFVSGIVLLVEQSIKPGDVIEVGGTFGWINSLSARYVSVLGRDGKSYLIPNETLITSQVVNWSYANPMIRLDVPFGVAYESDLHQVRALAIEAANAVKRVLGAPAPVCHVTAFGDNAIQLLLRFWIEDPTNGVTNVKGEVFLALWDTFRAHRIELPPPQQENRSAPRFAGPDNAPERTSERLAAE